MVKILCEGIGDQKFLCRFLDHLAINHSKENFQIMQAKSSFFNPNNPNYKSLNQAIENKEVTALLFILDADNDIADQQHGGYEKSLASIQTIIDNKSWQSISTVFIACDPKTQEGCLESLIYASLAKKQQDCINAFINCSEVTFGQGCKHKPIVFKIFSSVWGKPEKIDTFDHPHFSELKTQLRALFAKI